jgi:hypothetical protein
VVGAGTIVIDGVVRGAVADGADRGADDEESSSYDRNLLTPQINKMTMSTSETT